MNSVKKMRVDVIRANTAYPTYRGLIGIITIILMILAGLQAIGSFVLGASVGTMASNGFLGFVVVILGLAFAVLGFFLAKIWNEAAQILVDIGDSVMDANPSISPTPTPNPLSVPTSSSPVSAPPVH